MELLQYIYCNYNGIISSSYITMVLCRYNIRDSREISVYDSYYNLYEAIVTCHQLGYIGASSYTIVYRHRKNVLNTFIVFMLKIYCNYNCKYTNKNVPCIF